MDNEYVEYQWEWLGENKTGVNINHFKVDSSVRREGYGREALLELIDTFEEKGAEYIIINMKGGDDASQFIEELGFEVIEKHPSDGHITGEYEY
jgi:GNAT superfamily N-acetyltransferase